MAAAEAQRPGKTAMADELVKLTATEAAAEIARGAVSAEDYLRACLDRIHTPDGEIRASPALARDHPPTGAGALKEAGARRPEPAPLHGFPAATKDIIPPADYPTEPGPPSGRGRSPRHDATVVAKLRAAG